MPDLGEALAATASDAVLLVTPPDGHLAQARQIFAAGLPLLAEKPLTLDLDEAVAIVDLAAQAQLPLMVGLNFRYLPVSQKIRELVRRRHWARPALASSPTSATATAAAAASTSTRSPCATP